MELYILSPRYDEEGALVAYDTVGMIDEAESVLWQKRYNDAGQCEIYIPCSAEMFSLLSRGNYVFRYDDDMFCKIETPEIETDVENGDYIISTANDIAKVILSGRIVRWNIVYSGTVLGFLEKLVTDNVINPSQAQRKIANFELYEMTAAERAEFTERINVSAFTNDLYALIQTTCKTYGYGFRVFYNIETQKLVYRVFKGKNKASESGSEYIEFSPTYANILTSHYKEDESNYKNVAYVSYKAADEAIHLLSVYDGMDDGLPEPTGEARKEVYVDATGTSRDITLDELELLFGTVTKTTETVTEEEKEKYYSVYYSNGEAVATSWQDVPTGDEETEEKITVTDYTYLLLIRSAGNNALEQRRRTQEFTGEVDTNDTYEYKRDYNIGDIVKVKNKYGISVDARISEIMESEDNESGYVVEPVFEYLS